MTNMVKLWNCGRNQKKCQRTGPILCTRHELVQNHTLLKQMLRAMMRRPMEYDIPPEWSIYKEHFVDCLKAVRSLPPLYKRRAVLNPSTTASDAVVGVQRDVIGQTCRTTLLPEKKTKKKTHKTITATLPHQ